MAAPRHAPWAALPFDILESIALRLQCSAGRVHMALVCRHWRNAVPLQAQQLPPQLPWLLLPFPTTQALRPDGRRPVDYHCTTCCLTHHLRIRGDTGGARFFGSYDGGWAFLAHEQTAGHALVCCGTEDHINLPNLFADVGGGNRKRQAKMTMIVATLSSLPVPANNPCFAAAIVNVHGGGDMDSLAFWIVKVAGDDHTNQVATGFTMMSSGYEDVIHRNGVFIFLARTGDLMVCTTELQEEEWVAVHKEYRCVRGRVCHADEVARYLVSSRGDLLLVSKLLPGDDTAFAVFRLTEQQQQLSWTVLPKLDGRVLFVARGSSRSYEGVDFPGLEDAVYFLDDMNCTDDDIIRGCQRRYTCSHNGRWLDAPLPDLQSCFPDREPSDYTSPVWILPAEPALN